MFKVIVLLLIVAVIGGLVWLMAGGSRKLVRHQGSHPSKNRSGTRTTSRLPPGASQLEKLRENRLFWGVSLENPGCDAAMKIFEKGIPLAEAPELPLPGCDAVQCTCTWKGLTERRHTTRRTQHDRRDDVRFDEDSKKTDRRSHKDRRKGDATWERRDF
jgi:hypothetical protein